MTIYTQQQQEIIQERQEQAPCAEFSAMGFGSYASQDSFNSFDTASSTSSSQQLGLSGWGSAVSRTPYTCLKTLADDESRKLQSNASSQSSIVRQPRIIEGESWGYFVDTPDC